MARIALSFAAVLFLTTTRMDAQGLDQAIDLGKPSAGDTA